MHLQKIRGLGDKAIQDSTANSVTVVFHISDLLPVARETQMQPIRKQFLWKYKNT